MIKEFIMKIISKKLMKLSLVFILMFMFVNVFASENNEIASVDSNNPQLNLTSNKVVVLGTEDDVIYGFTKVFYQEHANFAPYISNYEYHRNGVRFIGTIYLKSTVQVGPNKFKGTYVGNLYEAGFAR